MILRVLNSTLVLEENKGWGIHCSDCYFFLNPADSDYCGGYCVNSNFNVVYKKVEKVKIK